MSDFTSIITDVNAFSDHVPELLNDTSYSTVKNTIARIKKAFESHPDVAAICAPQVDIKLRLFVIKLAKTESDRFKVFINPLIIKSEGLHLSRETNPSFPYKQFIIPRANSLHVAYQRADGQVSSETYSGAYAECIQQMIEMLDGVTLADYGLDLDDLGGPEAFDKAKKSEKEQVIALYLDSLKSLNQNMSEEIQNTPELKEIDDMINKFTEQLLAEPKTETSSEKST